MTTRYLPVLVVDTKSRLKGRGDMSSIAARVLNAAYYHIDGLKAGNVVAVVDAYRSSS